MSVGVRSAQGAGARRDGALELQRPRLRRRVAADPVERERRVTWRMPPLALLERPTWTRGRTTTMYLMYAYLFVAVVLLFVKAVQIS